MGWGKHISEQGEVGLSTFKMLHVIHDFAFSSVISDTWQAGDPAKCLDLAQRAYKYAEWAGYRDATAWALVVGAFGLEGLGRVEDAVDAYQQ